jgi:hypothetical protein
MFIEIIKLYNEKQINEFKMKCIYEDEKIEVSVKDNLESAIEHYDFHKEYIGGLLLEFKERMS